MQPPPVPFCKDETTVTGRLASGLMKRPLFMPASTKAVCLRSAHPDALFALGLPLCGILWKQPQNKGCGVDGGAICPPMAAGCASGKRSDTLGLRDVSSSDVFLFFECNVPAWIF